MLLVTVIRDPRRAIFYQLGVEAQQGLELVRASETLVPGGVHRARTDAAVYLTVYGEGGKKSDELRLTSKDDNFERGHADEFKVELESLGCLYKARIRHDNAGLMPGWKLDKVVLTHAVIENGTTRHVSTGAGKCPPLRRRPQKFWC